MLKVDFTRAGRSSWARRRLRVVGNLPYNISTPILFHLLDHVGVVEDQHFMLQKEVVDRMVAAPATADYGRLSVMLQWRYAMEDVLFVPPDAFDPPPRVDSAVVRMVPHAAPAPVDAALLSELVQVAFSQRRKLLRHTLGRWLEQRGFAGDVRPAAAGGGSAGGRVRRARRAHAGAPRRDKARRCRASWMRAAPALVRRRRASIPR